MRDRRKAFRANHARVAISHLIIKKGLLPTVYYHLTGCDPDLVASQIEKNDMPKDTGDVIEIIQVFFSLSRGSTKHSAITSKKARSIMLKAFLLKHARVAISNSKMKKGLLPAVY